MSVSSPAVDFAGAFPGSRKVYVSGECAGHRLAVPTREIALAGGERSNPPLNVYDSSGPYTDPDTAIDLRGGLSPIRDAWIRARGDIVDLPAVSSQYGRQRLEDARLAALRFPNMRRPRVARAGGNVTQMHYARKGIITPEMEFIATRENQRLIDSLGVNTRGSRSARPFRGKSLLSS